ncbi:unnamed protein product [Ilex paraguariensis]|uniref:CCDC93 coiled-coil domain-containing protein n=1 Tax=Ilex paraguariensis TaxID=185542 RepID=A0ABC8T8E8_9AQUA
MQEEDHREQVTCTEFSIEDETHSLLQHQEEFNSIKSSISTLSASLEELNKKKADLLGRMQHLREKISKEGAEMLVQRLLSLLESLKALEKQESDSQLHSNVQRSQLQAEIDKLGEIILSDNDGWSFSCGIDDSLHSSVEKLNSAKTELAAKLREIVLLKRQLDDVPSQAELIQYERRFSELNVHIQGKLRQTRKCYATYNALLEIKELMLKETSLLNSISLQFQDAIASTSGRVKLIDSMDGITKGIQQKLEKAHLAQQAELTVCDALKEKYAAAISEQRRCSSLLKAFQEECAKNERLRSHTSGILA